MPSPLSKIAHEARISCVKIAGQGGCFLGASLSCVDILTFLYSGHLRVAPDSVSSPDRDYFLLSKGHAVPALYAVLAEFGYLDKSRLSNHLQIEDCVYWHPNTAIRGIDFHSGSLGHCLPVAAGVAKAQQLEKSGARTVVLLGDGELNEGSIWEAMQTAAALKLGNLVAIVDRNRFQANTETESLSPLEPLADKVRSFNWNAIEADGHSFESLAEAYAQATQLESERPSLIIANTTRGKGIPSIENLASGWFVNAEPARLETLLAELCHQAR